MPVTPTTNAANVASEFTVVDLTPQCEARQKAQYTYGLLERLSGAPDLLGFCSGQLWQSPEEFQVSLPASLAQLELRWRSVAATAGILTVRNSSTVDADHRTLSLSLLASGIEPEADRVTLSTFQQHIVHELHDTGFEPAFDLLELHERPLVATIGLATPPQEKDGWAFAMLDRCFAASYFRRLGLV
jgi:hypothetical protein